MSNGRKESQDSYYVCPMCKQPLIPTIKGLFCQQDGVEYSIKNGIVDFVVGDLTESTNFLLRSPILSITSLRSMKARIMAPYR